MKLLCKKLSQSLDTSFSASMHLVPCLDEHLHFHPEYELILILKGYGTKLVGDSVRAFHEGDLAFVGPNVPHLWRNDVSFQNDMEMDAKVAVIQFREDFLGKDFFCRNEMNHITQLFYRSKAGLNITGSTAKIVRKKMLDLFDASPFERIMLLLSILDVLAQSNGLQELASQGYSHNFTHADTHRMDKVYKYMIDHFKNDIDLDEIASVACLSTSAFCKYFKKRTKKTFSEFLNELKIGHACKLLIRDDFTISQVCFESGFQSITNFNRQFKSITHMAPYEYRKQYLIV